MNSRVLYRIAAVLILLFDIGHTAAFPWSDPGWGVDTTVMRTSHFQVLGVSRTYWSFYVGFGLFVTAFLLIAAVLAWQLGGLSPEALQLLRGTQWALSLCFSAVAVLSWLYFFAIPIAFSIAITICLVGAAWTSARNRLQPSG